VSARGGDSGHRRADRPGPAGATGPTRADRPSRFQPAVANEFTDNFNQPERQWDILATPERTSAFLARHGM
jgi:hypothetical protein